MAIDDTRLFELAIEALEEKRRSIDEEIAQLRRRLPTARAVRIGTRKGQAKQTSTAKLTSRQRGRRKMTAAQRKAASERMKKVWAERKKGKK